MKSLENKVAIVTGGANGIGKATALRFAAEGATVIIWDLNKASASQLIKDLQKINAACAFHEVDISDLNKVQEATQACIISFGRIDILINNAGILRDASLLKMTEEQFDLVIDVNLKGFFNCTKAVAPFMIKNGYGRIVQASSVVALYGNFGQTNYVAAKAGIIGMTKVWARELGPKGITVNAIAPGFIATDMMNAIPEDTVNAAIAQVPVRRMGKPEDVANLYLFLASDQASYINGAVISIDGGAVF